jgi:hypothetical protein
MGRPRSTVTEPEPEPVKEPEREPEEEAPVAKSEEVDLRPEETTELTPEEAKTQRQERKEESLAATGGDYPSTPSGRALAEVGDLDGEDADSPEAAREHGLAYARAKRKYRWGY